MKKIFNLQFAACIVVGSMFLWCTPRPAFSQSVHSSGSVCLGMHLGKAREQDEFKRLYLKIGSSDEIHFDPSQKARIVASNLDLHKTYRVKVFFDSQLVESWPLRFDNLGFDKPGFDKLKSAMVIIWRDAGAWRMEPVEKCEWRW